ncbi:nucleoside hydrolase [Arundinibacter roseus]|nr:nucleoside hydrolase [Arundinibacter roseus]
MLQNLFCFLFLNGLFLLPVVAQVKLPTAPPIQIILDTDMDSDVDDAGALAMLHSYEKLGLATILGIIVTSDDAHSAPCTKAITTYFGRGEIPIGVSQRDSLLSFSRYTKQVAAEFPTDLATNADAEDGTVVYRRLLANAPDGSVVILTIGHLTSLSRLLNSPPDSISDLNGKDLVAKKVTRWSCMGGQYPSGKEANFYRPDPASTVDCLAQWKLPVTFAGWEVGQQLVTGGADFKAKATENSPVYRAYSLYNNFKGRASWDQVSVLEAVEGVEPYFERVTEGQCVVASDGSNTWQAPANGLHGYLRMKAPTEVIRKRIDDLMLGNF